MPAYDFKKAQKGFYSPPASPVLCQLPSMQFLAVQGQGDPNQPQGAYAKAVELLYALSYALRMSEKQGHVIPGYFPYVVAPLEGLWWMPGLSEGMDYRHKEAFHWVSLIRQPDFVTQEALEWAKEVTAAKKGLDPSPAFLLCAEEGLCVQCLHTGSFDEEPATMEKIDLFLEEQGLQKDLSEQRRHHEIYLSDPRRTPPEKLRTVIREPVAKKR